MAPSLDLWSRASRGTPISTLVSAPGSESMPKSPPSISAPTSWTAGPLLWADHFFAASSTSVQSSCAWDRHILLRSG